MGSDLKAKIKVIQDAFSTWLELNPQDQESALETLRTEAFRLAFQKYKSEPEILEKNVLEVENAFCQLSQVKRVLSGNSSRAQIPCPELLADAKLKFKDKRYAEALASCERAIHTGIETEEAHLLCATAALYAKDLPRADRYANLVLKNNMSNPHALVVKALCIKADDPIKALEYLDRAQRLRPDSKVIQGYREGVLQLLGSEKSTNKTDPFGFKRKWIRAPLVRDLYVNDVTNSILLPCRTVSLSAGGCYIPGKTLPKEFRFSLSLKQFGKIHGFGEVAYNGKDGAGIRFRNLSTQEQMLIDQEVKSLIK